MNRSLIFVFASCWLFLAGTALAVPIETVAAASADAGDKDGQPVLTQYLNTSRNNIVRGVSMAAKFVGKLPKMGKEATIEARKKILPSGEIEYSVIDRSGDKTVQKDLIARYMGAEMDSAAHPSEQVAVNESNYKFKVKGLQEREGHRVHVIEVTPRKKRTGLFKGEVWLDPETGLTLCETGRFVKSPSVFLKKVEFARKFTIREGKSVPLELTTNIQTRFWGKAELRIDYSDIQFESTGEATQVGQNQPCLQPNEDDQATHRAFNDHR